MSRTERLVSSNHREGDVIVTIVTGVVRNVLDAIDQGMSTQQIRESLMRIEEGTAIPGQDTRLFVLGISQVVRAPKEKINESS